MASEDCDALGISPSNNQIQKTGAGVACQDNESLPASDLERSLLNNHNQLGSRIALCLVLPSLLIQSLFRKASLMTMAMSTMLSICNGCKMRRYNIQSQSLSIDCLKTGDGLRVRLGLNILLLLMREMKLKSVHGLSNINVPAEYANTNFFARQTAGSLPKVKRSLCLLS